MIEALKDLVAPDGTITAMSSGQGSVANNEHGGFEVYRGTKAALNMFMRSHAARHHNDPRTLLLMAPGWVKTGLGGPNARPTINESIPNLVKVIDAQRGHGGLQYLDYRMVNIRTSCLSRVGVSDSATSSFGEQLQPDHLAGDLSSFVVGERTLSITAAALRLRASIM